MPKILIIEDNKEVRENIAELLELFGYETIQAENGKEGVKKAVIKLPDLILCDIMMPEEDGYTVLNKLSLNIQTSAIPFVFLTAKSEKQDLRKGMNLGADDYITKPYSDDDLIQTIKTRLEKSQSIKKYFKNKDTSWSKKELNTKLPLDELFRSSKIIKFKKGETIYFENETQTNIYKAIEGQIKLLKEDKLGNEIILKIIEKNEAFAIESAIGEQIHLERAVCMNNSEVLTINLNEFKKNLSENREIAAWLLKSMSNNIAEKEKRLLSMAYKPTRKRLALVLLELNEKHPNLKYNRDELSSIIGATRETVIRLISDFKEKDIIYVEGRKIIIKDQQRLENIAR